MSKTKILATVFFLINLSNLAFLAPGPDEALAGGKPLPTVLESSSNDVIRLQMGEVPDETIQSSINPGKTKEARSPKVKFGKHIKQRLVTICLKTAADMSGAKAFDIRKNEPPRYVAQPGAQTCARFEPTRHTLYFWKTNNLGKLSLILSNHLDLSDSDGTQVTLNWVKD